LRVINFKQCNKPRVSFEMNGKIVESVRELSYSTSQFR